MGFSFFQGYYFCRPEMTQHKQPISDESILLGLYAESLKPELDNVKLIQLFNKDAGLAYKLLCFVNSGGFPLKNKISNIKYQTSNNLFR